MPCANAAAERGVGLPNGGRLRIIFLPKSANGHPGANGHTVDSRIIATALKVRRGKPRPPTILVTKDINLRIRADALGLAAEDYETGRIQLSDLYSGMFERAVTAEQLTAFRADGELGLAAPSSPNEYCTLSEAGAPRRTALGRVTPTAGGWCPSWIAATASGASNRAPRAALRLRCPARRPHQAGDPHGQGRHWQDAPGHGRRPQAHHRGPRVPPRGHRPPHHQRRQGDRVPARDARGETQPLDAADPRRPRTPQRPQHGQRKPSHGDLMRSGAIVVEALSYIRGRSIAHQFMVIDEAQNLTPLEVKTIVTRVGHGTKIVFTGDPLSD